MDDFREWLSDNLRYFMLGFGILAVVLIFRCSFYFLKIRKSENNRTETGDTAGDGNTDSDAGSRRNTGNNRGTGNNTGSRRAGTECLSAGQCTDRKILCSTDRQRRAEFKRTGG